MWSGSHMNSTVGHRRNNRERVLFIRCFVEQGWSKRYLAGHCGAFTPSYSWATPFPTLPNHRTMPLQLQSPGKVRLRKLS